MSYRSINTDDLTKKYFFDLGNFVNILPQLANAKSEQAWELWFEKLALIDRRSLYRYLKEHVDTLTVDQKDFAEWYLKKDIEDEAVAEPDMILYYYNNQDLCSVITVKDKGVSVKNYTDNIFHRAFGNNESPTYQDFQDFLKSRCFPEERRNKKKLLDLLGIDHYDPLEIIKKTEGRMAEDNSWIRIEENIDKRNVKKNSFIYFRSNLHHMIRQGETELINTVVNNNDIEKLWEQKEYVKALYLLATVDFLCKKSNRPIIEKYAKYRTKKLAEPFLISYDDINREEPKEKNKYIKEFVDFNIFEGDLYDSI